MPKTKVKAETMRFLADIDGIIFDWHGRTRAECIQNFDDAGGRGYATFEEMQSTHNYRVIRCRVTPITKKAK